MMAAGVCLANRCRSRRFLWIEALSVWLLITLCRASASLTIYDYFSKWNRERPVRQRTDYIILHTTEGQDSGSLRKIHENGEANYFLDSGGNVYKVIDRRKVALHAGRSMWNGRTDLDNYSIGIEVAGYHDGNITSAQYTALRELLSQLKTMYNIPDDRILTHSMVAYAAPNRWYTRSHRGRKRCGMLFAKRSIRLKLGLQSQPLSDPDVQARRLVVGDAYLASVLYGSAREQETAARKITDSASGNVISKNKAAWDIAGPKYNSAEILYVFPDGTEVRGNKIEKWNQMPIGTKVVFAENQRDNEEEKVCEIGVDGQDARDIAGDEYNRETTIYFLLDGRIKRGTELTDFDLLSLPPKTRMLVGYVCVGYVTASKTAIDLCGKRWNFPSTFYRFPNGTIRAGNTLNDNSIPRNTIAFCSN
jgi:hypothetical protein